MIVLYSTGCSKCKVLELKLQQLQKPFQVEKDKDIVVAVGQEHKITGAPILQVDNNYYDFSAALKYLKDCEQQS